MLNYENGLLTVDEEADKIKISNGEWYFFCNLNGKTDLPLPFGDGTYTVQTFRRISGNTYRPLKNRRVVAKGTSAYLLKPNLYVPYTPAWDYARELVGAQMGLDAYKTVKNWVKRHIIYDYIKAVKVSKKGDLPDPLGCFMNKRGICQDIASLATGMLRAVGVRSRLVIGYADHAYHAWTEATVDGQLYRFDPCGKADTYVRERWY